MIKSPLSFVKYSGNGNDFIILDRPSVPVTPGLVKRLCNRHFGVGADGVLVLLTWAGGEGEMRIFNADGGEAEMCGNGLRCLGTYTDDISLIKKDVYTIKTMNNVYSVRREGASFAIEMSEIKDKNPYHLSGFNEFEESFFINTGVPHLVFLGKDVKSLDIRKTAPKYRYHSIFPGGTNVNLVELLDPTTHRAYVRTYERGVEDETYSCGTGLTAVALALNHWFGWEGPIHLLTRGGNQVVNVGDKITFFGEVIRCFRGEFYL